MLSKQWHFYRSYSS